MSSTGCPGAAATTVCTSRAADPSSRAYWYSLTLSPSVMLPTQTAGDPVTELHVLDTVAQLKTLRSLDLCINLPEEIICRPDLSALRPNAPCVAHLSALTALTRLRLVMSECYEHAADSYTAHFGAAPEGGGSWAEVQEAHRTSLLAALRCMPQLQHLHCPTLWLTAGDAAPLTALTSMSLAGLLPPPLEQPSMQPATVGALRNPTKAVGRAVAIALPPQLRELTLLKRTSPRALALLQPPPSLIELDFNELSFGTTDVTVEGRLRPEAVDAVGAAVQLLLRFCCCHYNKFIVGADGGPGPLQPREDSPDGHMEWIRQLKGLTVCGSVLLDKIELSAGDLCCLAQTLPGLTGKRKGANTCISPRPWCCSSTRCSPGSDPDWVLLVQDLRMRVARCSVPHSFTAP